MKKENLLSRDDFRNMVLTRDKNTCIIPGCGKPAVDAHHIIERRLWQDESEFGGYFLSNGASLCEEHHVAAEKNFFPPQYLWQILKVEPTKSKLKPKSFNPDIDYNKWGTAFKMPTRYKIKYPSTPYLPFSPQWKPPHTAKDDEAFMENIDCFLEAPLVMTIKLDGSNVLLSKDRVAARNGTVANHKSFDFLKALHARRYSYLIPENVEVFGEWLYAKHSIHYTGDLSLQNYLYIFGVYNMKTRLWGSWNDVEKMATILGVPTVPVIKMTGYNSNSNSNGNSNGKGNGYKHDKHNYSNSYDTYDSEWQFIRDVSNTAQNIVDQGHEGVVVRIAYPFHYGQFSDHIAKYVRPDHVQTDKHWAQQPVIRNVLRGGV